MSYLNTELTIALQKNKSIPEFSRRHLKVTINDPCQTELTAFLGYEKYDSVGWNSGNSRNGCYNHVLDTKFYVIVLESFISKHFQRIVTIQMILKQRLFSCIAKALQFAKSETLQKKCMDMNIAI